MFKVGYYVVGLLCYWVIGLLDYTLPVLLKKEISKGINF
jgi:hypothetical protein